LAVQGTRLDRQVSRNLRRKQAAHQYEEFISQVKRIVPVGTKGKMISLRVRNRLREGLRGRGQNKSCSKSSAKNILKIFQRVSPNEESQFSAYLGAQLA